MKYWLLIIGVWLLVCGPAAMFAAAQTEGIAVVVNEDAISFSDLNDRMRLILVSSGFPNTDEVKQKLLPQIASSLVEEQLKMQEARQLEITVSPQEIEEGLGTIAQQNNMDVQQFKGMLAQGQINPATLERQIESQIAWGKVIQKKFRPEVVISENDIDAFIERIARNKGKKEYLAAEIFLPVEGSGNEEETRALAEKIMSEVQKNKGSFYKLAQQFSKSAGAPQGGDMGWVQEGQIAPELGATLAGMSKGDLSAPVRDAAGYHLLFLREVRTISDESIPPREQVEQILGIQRLERAQARHLLNLKSEAFIENRV